MPVRQAQAGVSKFVKKWGSCKGRRFIGCQHGRCQTSTGCTR
jgi:hypothetical protein